MAEPRFEYVVLTPAQRSGSTLMQRLLNANPKTVVWGEHGGALRHLVSAYWQLAAFADADEGVHRRRLLSSNRTAEWTANASPPASIAWNATVDAARTLIESLYCSVADRAVRSVGFKEVQYGAEEIALIQAAFPNSKIILLVRHPMSTLRAVANQGWSTDQLLVRWSTNVLGYIDSVHRYENVWLFRYEDLASARRETVEALAQVARVDDTDILDVLSRRVAGPPGYSDPGVVKVSGQVMFSVEHTCGPILEQLRAIAPNGRPIEQSI